MRYEGRFEGYFKVVEFPGGFLSRIEKTGRMEVRRRSLDCRRDWRRIRLLALGRERMR